jgi:hypothetical protein
VFQQSQWCGETFLNDNDLEVRYGTEKAGNPDKLLHRPKQDAEYK